MTYCLTSTCNISLFKDPFALFLLIFYRLHTITRTKKERKNNTKKKKNYGYRGSTATRQIEYLQRVYNICSDSGHFERDTQSGKSGEIFDPPTSPSATCSQPQCFRIQLLIASATIFSHNLSTQYNEWHINE